LIITCAQQKQLLVKMHFLTPVAELCLTGVGTVGVGVGVAGVGVVGACAGMIAIFSPVGRTEPGTACTQGASALIGKARTGRQDFQSGVEPTRQPNVAG